MSQISAAEKAVHTNSRKSPTWIASQPLLFLVKKVKRFYGLFSGRSLNPISSSSDYQSVKASIRLVVPTRFIMLCKQENYETKREIAK